MLLMSRLFYFIFPRRHELALFSMAVAMLALVVAAPDFRGLITSAISYIAEDLLQTFRASTWEGLKSLVGASGIVFAIASSIFVSLYLPFTEKNFDVFLPVIIGIHLLVVMTSNFLLFQERQDAPSAIIAGAGLIYFMLFCTAYRLRYVTHFTSAHQATPRQALIAALSVFALVVLLSAGLGWHWAHSYAFVLGYALTVGSFANAIAGRGV